MKNLLQKYLSTEEKPLIKQPMHENCQLVVTVPVYNESFETLLNNLASLARQEQILPHEFEVIVIVNNSKQEAREKTEAFLQNQKIIKLVSAIIAKKYLRQNKIAQGIVESGIHIRLIDKSSEFNAYEENYIAKIRNRVTAEIYQRFLTTKIGSLGIFNLGDCEAVYSKNFVNRNIELFRTFGLNACSGQLQYTLDPKVKNSEILAAAFKSFFKRPLVRPLGNKIIFQKPGNKPIINCCPNLTLTVKAFFEAGGLPLHYSRAGAELIEKLILLPGKIARDYNHAVYMPLRLSERAGLFGFGRILKSISSSIEDFERGRSAGIFAPDNSGLIKLFSEMRSDKSKTVFYDKDIRQLFLKSGAMIENIVKKDFDLLVKMANKDLKENSENKSFRNFERAILNKANNFFPKFNITKQIADVL